MPLEPISPPIDLGRAFYEWQIAKARSPMRSWDQLEAWEHEGERLTARERAVRCWTVEHPEATDWPPGGVTDEYAIASMDRWGAWPR